MISFDVQLLCIHHYRLTSSCCSNSTYHGFAWMHDRMPGLFSVPWCEA
jgi:hypothetical protein